MSDLNWVQCSDNQLHVFKDEDDTDENGDRIWTSACGKQVIDETFVDLAGGFYECSIDEIYNGCEDCIREVLG